MESTERHLPQSKTVESLGLSVQALSAGELEVLNTFALVREGGNIRPGSVAEAALCRLMKDSLALHYLQNDILRNSLYQKTRAEMKRKLREGLF